MTPRPSGFLGFLLQAIQTNFRPAQFTIWAKLDMRATPAQVHLCVFTRAQHPTILPARAALLATGATANPRSNDAAQDAHQKRK